MVKEDPKKVAERVKRYKEKHKIQRLQLDLHPDIKQKFDALPGEKDITRFKLLLDFYYQSHPLPQPDNIPEIIDISKFNYELKEQMKMIEKSVLRDKNKEKLRYGKYLKERLPEIKEALDHIANIIFPEMKAFILKGYWLSLSIADILDMQKHPANTLRNLISFGIKRTYQEAKEKFNLS